MFNIPGNRTGFKRGSEQVPNKKIQDIKQNIEGLMAKKKATLKEIQQLLGKLNFAARVIPAGCTFARRLAWLTKGITRKHHGVRVTTGVRRDFQQWHSFLSNFIGTLEWWAPWVIAEQLSLYIDAAGS